MYRIFLKWFIFSFIILLCIAYSIAIYAMGLDQLLGVIFNGIINDLLMLTAPSIVVAISLTRWQLKKEKGSQLTLIRSFLLHQHIK